MTNDHGKAETLFGLCNVAFSVSGRDLLGPVTLSLSAAEITGLIGHNGSGKSTLLKLLSRQVRPTEGTIRFQGRPLDDWGAREFSRKLAYMPQTTPPATGLLVKELVAFGRYPWHGAVGRFSAQDREKVDEAIEITGISPFADRLVDTLSGGERQRVWLAMLMAQGAECLLLDEPISALDVAHQIEVLSLIQTLSETRKIGVVVILHDINMASRYCNRIVALRGGRIVADGSSDDIMTHDQLRDIYGIPMDVVLHPATGQQVALAR